MPNPLVYFEIGCRDKAATREFYSKLFEWPIDSDGRIKSDNSSPGGHINSLGHEPHNYTIFYVRVDNLQESISKAESLGGKKLVGPVSLPGGDAFAWIQDPEGNTMGLYTGA
jgi:uncharacterized protein